ncbi:conjugal transfer protein TraM [Tannerella sp. oral taxon BU063 isolate Cell 6/7/9]|uniref:Conjugal transfer protein TraM n=1 Tax=Tannerella sp. oral taxon BU063 isolate Cell 6/7/9 TaxID=1411021 RepID=W2CP19_9BACT|nr:conjugal transfer protein TraM [Tannerella sp. oral taxon BU063 isolate Cell 6/7/9]ETK08237.1 conjugal transfer protein TraM [Tannerella sp. oral taxon BU063 isolate Cell 6/7/9]
MDTKRKEQLQRTLVFTGLGLLFTLSIWFIFRPSADEQSAAEQGLNKDVPQASPDELPTSKLKAYELGRDEEAEGRKSQLLGTLADYFNREGEAKAEPEPAEEVPAAIGRSIDKYEETARELESFYDLPAVEDDDVKRELNALRAELGALKEEKAQANGEVDQLELLEKSYQMAAKYLPSGNTPTSPTPERSTIKPPASELPAAELSPERETVVSSLDQPISDSTFIAEYGYKERNMGFRSVGKATPSIARNTLSVVVDRTTTIRQGDFLRLRLAEPARIEGMTLPPNTVLIAQSTIDGNRMKLHVTSVEHAGRILAVKLSAFDLDGQEGLSIPGSEEVSALKEVGAGVGGTIGTSFTFASSAKDQLIAEAARGVMQGASQLLQKKLRTIKVTVKSGHRLFLVQAK